MKELFSLNKYFVKHKSYLIWGMIFVTLSNLFDILSPPIVREILDTAYDNLGMYTFFQNTTLESIFKSEVMAIVMVNGILLLAFAIIRGIFMYMMRQTIIVMSRHIEYEQKNDIFKHYQKLDTKFFRNNSTGDLMSRISEDVSRVRQYVGPAIMYIINLVTLTIMSLYCMFSVNSKMAFYSIIPLPILALTIYYVNKLVNKKSEKIQTQLSKITSIAQETYSGIRVVQSFNHETTVLDNFKKESESYKKKNIDLNMTEAIYFPSMTLFIGLSTLTCILIGGYFVMQGEITAGNIAEFVIYINKLTFPISAIGWTANMITRAEVSQSRINEFLKTEPEIFSQNQPIDAIQRFDISFENVNFVYTNTGTQALKDFNLQINEREKICILGKTGSGKSTISHLLLRMYDADSGSVILGGRNIKDYDLSVLRQNFAYVPQDVFLFSDSIYNNIAFGLKDVSKEEVIQAAKKASIYNEIMSLPQGFDTVIGERGVTLSGGQKQRISIARALLRKSNILVLDESLSAVDTQTEQVIQQNLINDISEKSVIIITHRIFKNWNFDNIIFMIDGEIVEQGTHEEMMELKGHYFELYNYQVQE